MNLIAAEKIFIELREKYGLVTYDQFCQSLDCCDMEYTQLDNAALRHLIAMIYCYLVIGQENKDSVRLLVQKADIQLPDSEKSVLASIERIEHAIARIIAQQFEMTPDEARVHNKNLSTTVAELKTLIESTLQTSKVFTAKVNDTLRGRYNGETLLTSVIMLLLNLVNQTQVSFSSVLQDLETTHEQLEKAETRVDTLSVELNNISTLVRFDTLTKLLNRFGMLESFSREISRSRRYQTALSVALLDLDNFKQINDVYGHTTGDGVLLHCASLLLEQLRITDVVARYGGEEFVILLPNTPLERANLVVNRLLDRLKYCPYELANGDQLVTTFSAGITALAPDDTAESVISRADKEMYKAKENGKSQVSCDISRT